MADWKPQLIEGPGYFILRGVIPLQVVTECRAVVAAAAEGRDYDVWPGVRSKRIKDPLEWGGPAFSDLINVSVDKLHEGVGSVLGPYSWLTSFHALSLDPTPETIMSPEEELKRRQGSLHNDYPYGEFKEAVDREILGDMEGTVGGRPMGHDDMGWQFPMGHKPGRGAPHTIQTIWVLDDFTEVQPFLLIMGSMTMARCMTQAPTCRLLDDKDHE